NSATKAYIFQSLPPRLFARFRLSKFADVAKQPLLLVDSIHDERGYRSVRSALARQYDAAHIDPDIQIVDVDLAGERKLILQHRVEDGILIDPIEGRSVLHHLADLWGYPVELVAIDGATDAA